MQPLDNCSNRSHAFLEESLKLASEALVEMETEHKRFIKKLIEKHQLELESLESDTVQTPSSLNAGKETGTEAVTHDKKLVSILLSKHQLELEILENEISALRKSWSWRITGPARKIYDFLSR